MDNNLTLIQQEVLDAIKSHKRNNDGNSPKVRELAASVMRATSNTQRIITILKRKGYLEKRRGIYVVGGNWTYEKGKE